MKNDANEIHPILYTLHDKDIDIYIDSNNHNELQYVKKYGEVFTPPSLIYEMLDTIPKEVWSNPNLKWLEPSCGVGNIMIYVFQRLYKGLKNHHAFKDATKRKHHILQSMLYMIEINEKNTTILKQIFGKHANIYNGDFLDVSKWMKHFGFVSASTIHTTTIPTFDIIIGNPPFQMKQTNEIRKGGYGKKKLWPTFVELSLEILKQNGYLVYIHPPSWRGVGEVHYIWKMFQQKQLEYLHMYDETDGRKYFITSDPKKYKKINALCF